MAAVQEPAESDFDVIIVGAGLSGINAAYRIQTNLPGYKYTILENRGAMGGTWDLFRYPGIRSDSDLHTFGFPWRPWTHTNAIADGPSIKKYIEECAATFGIDHKIRFHHKLCTASWSSDHQKWTLVVDSKGEKKTFTARFIVFGTGYYNYNQPLEATIPGIEKFKGNVIHPQFWAEDVDYTDKKIVVIGSGATAVTLVPNLAKKAAKVTMLQRSPTYVIGIPTANPIDKFIRDRLPTWLANTMLRWKFIMLPFIFFKFCQAFPARARKIIRKNAKMQLPKSFSLDPTFNPSYNPWEQRLCVCPDGDFFKALGSGKADVVTDTIQTVTEAGIETVSGKKLDADIIVTATGLKMQLAGGAEIFVDGKPITLSSKFFWRSVMLQDIPNATVVVGYTNASWTLGSDTTASLICRLLKYMDKNHLSSATPRIAAGTNLVTQPFLDLKSTYIDKAKADLPKAGNKAPWQPRSDFFTDAWFANFATLGSLIQGLEFKKVFEAR